MRRQILVLAAGALLAGCASGNPSSAQTGRPGARLAPFNPVTMLIEARDTLGLLDMQVDAMRRVADDLQRKNQPLQAQLGPRRREGPGGGRGPRGGGMPGGGEGGRRGGGGGRPGALPAGADSIFRRIEANNREALERVDALLTEEQRTRAAELLERRRPVRPGERPRAAPPASSTTPA